jgi:uncharacterized repeat protein (TIGR03803 family)
MRKIGFIERACFVAVFCVAAAIASPAQTFSTLNSFDGTDGGDPNRLVQGTDGNFYGTTVNGGATRPCPPSNDGPGCGTVFEITPTGVLTTLHSFNGSDGSGPNGLIQGSDGKFYGTTLLGGNLSLCNGTGCGPIEPFACPVSTRSKWPILTKWIKRVVPGPRLTGAECSFQTFLYC